MKVSKVEMNNLLHKVRQICAEVRGDKEKKVIAEKSDEQVLSMLVDAFRTLDLALLDKKVLPRDWTPEI